MTENAKETSYGISFVALLLGIPIVIGVLLGSLATKFISTTVEETRMDRAIIASVKSHGNIAPKLRGGLVGGLLFGPAGAIIGYNFSESDEIFGGSHDLDISVGTRPLCVFTVKVDSQLIKFDGTEHDKDFFEKCISLAKGSTISIRKITKLSSTEYLWPADWSAHKIRGEIVNADINKAR